jgi:glycosyltransferase involved in cell wall biosynthesis
MAHDASGVIGDSEYISAQVKRFNSNVAWIPDNIPMERVPTYRQTTGMKRLRLLWSGESVKLFELLAAEKALVSHQRNIELVLVTNALSGLDRLVPDIRRQLDNLLAKLNVRFVPFQSIKQLFEIYSQGGVFVSPRFLDSPYNMGHTEWKITLAMACGRTALCSPVPSYTKVAERTNGKGIRICEDEESWYEAFEELSQERYSWREEELAARSVVENYYDAGVVAKQHVEFVKEILAVNQSPRDAYETGG